MTYLPSEIGHLLISTEWRDDFPGSGSSHAELTGVEWQGPPVTFLEERQLRFLTGKYVEPHQDLIEVGPYVLRRADRDPYNRGHFWLLVGQGEWYWLRWQLRRALDSFWRRVVMTLAVWGLADWPEYGSLPRWRDVLKRWRR